DSPGHFKIFAISILLTDIQYRRCPSPKSRRNTPFVQFYILDRICIKNRKETQQMGGIVNNGLVQEHQILIGGTSPNMKATGTLPIIGYSREHLQGLYNIQLPQY